MAAPQFLSHCQELLAPLGAVRSRRMFGGWGLYVDEIFLALIIEERLYLKTDGSTRARFEAAGCTPFVYHQTQGKAVTVSYYTAPDEALDAPALMEPWARLALQAALAHRATGVKRRPKPPAAAAAKRPARRPPGRKGPA
ncbi:DNA transformation protein [Rubrivivax sp. A210]|uniref:TfoX/Sxy family protein n=1 Tax=Rubrivivax sp. A210 TaxID=2772301 RepID=UPI00191B622D|nr:TfoX/Sxy family protein [Rubrivivax sp. A210]CAD5374200.1 DNA transformation protein [Rubrivivax sp. A210]